MSVMLRPLAAADSLQELTALLHTAYAALGAQGWNFTAVDQSVELTAKRVAGGGCLVAVDEGGRMVGTVNMRGPYRPEQDAWCLDTPWYLRDDTAILSQFAVDPGCQGQGLGARLMDAAEAWAAARGYLHVALDTAEPAVQLQRRYAQRGYRTVGRTQWEGKTYASVLMVKPLPQHSPLRVALLRMAHYNLWATRRLLAAVDLLSEAQYRQDLGLFFKSVHGTLNHLLVGELLLWQPRFADGASPVMALDAEAEPDRARLRERLLEGVARWPAIIGALGEAQLNGRLDYKTSKGQPAGVPMAAGLQHVLNHGTHHRGQISAALTALGQECPELDLIYMLREWPQPTETVA